MEFDSYMVPESDLELGQLRLLEVDNRVVVPVDTHIRFIVTGQDVAQLGEKTIKEGERIPGRFLEEPVPPGYSAGRAWKSVKA
ncbi:MAG: hypothetical protein EOO61_13810 [Hymenobacter sp.]|nr:MAG: hypothetical protein EOO61_13810 [Hymenobacter sp.]